MRREGGRERETYSVGLLETSVVCNIFALCHSSVDELVHFVQFVTVVLVNETLGPVPELPDGSIVPPLHHVTVLVELSTCTNTIRSTDGNCVLVDF